MLTKHLNWLTLPCLVEMIVILLISLTAVTNALEVNQIEVNEDIKKVIGKYIDKIPDIDSHYVINEGLSKAISHFFKGKIKTFPMYKITLKIDRNPVKIPWILSEPNQNLTIMEREYKYVTPEKKKIN